MSLFFTNRRSADLPKEPSKPKIVSYSNDYLKIERSGLFFATETLGMLNF